MITKNGLKALLGIKALGKSTGSLSFKDTAGTSFSSWSASNASGIFKTATTSNVSTSSTSGSMCLMLGLNDTPETLDDYAINTDLNGVNVNSVVTCQNAVDGAITTTGTMYFQYTFTNTGSDAVVIKELGLCWIYDTHTVLCARKVISPRTIGAGETVSFAYEILT